MPRVSQPAPALIEDWKLGVATVLMEAGGEPYEGKVAVAAVIHERMRSKYFSDGSVGDTVLKPLQFSCWNSVHPARAKVCCSDLTSPQVQEALRAWVDASRANPWKGVVLYHAASMAQHPTWASSDEVELVKQIGGHLFYRVRKVA